jgi:hypothetical protein
VGGRSRLASERRARIATPGSPARRRTFRAGWLNQVFTMNCHFFLKWLFGMTLLWRTILAAHRDAGAAVLRAERGPAEEGGAGDGTGSQIVSPCPSSSVPLGRHSSNDPLQLTQAQPACWRGYRQQTAALLSSGLRCPPCDWRVAVDRRPWAS